MLSKLLAVYISHLDNSKQKSIKEEKLEAYVAAMHLSMTKAQDIATEFQLTLSEYDEEYPDDIEALSDVEAEFNHLKNAILSHYKVGEPLYKYVSINELLEEDRVKFLPKTIRKKETSSVSSTSKLTDNVPLIPQAIDKKPVQQNVLPLGNYQKLLKYCAALLPYCESFTPAFSDVARGELTQEAHQQEHLRNIVASLTSINELASILVSGGSHASITSMLHLKIAILLEQSAKLAVALKPITFSSSSKLTWKQHAPHVFTELLQNKGLLKLDDNEQKFLKQLEKFIAISSRYPSSNSDLLCQTIEQLFKLEDSDFDEDQLNKLLGLRIKQVQNFLDKGMEICLKIIESVLNSSLDMDDKPKITKQFAKLDLMPHPAGWNESLETKWNQASNNLQRIQKFILLGNELQTLDEEQTVSRRESLIWTCSRNLELNLRLLKESLGLSYACPLTIAESVYLRKAVILESLLEMFVASLPLPSEADVSVHYFWNIQDNFCRRSHRHELQNYLSKLESHLTLNPDLVLQTQNSISLLEPYLKKEYRYQGNEVLLLTPFKAASEYRLDLIAEQNFTKLLELDSYIQELLDCKIRQSTSDFLTMIDTWLNLYHKLQKEKKN